MSKKQKRISIEELRAFPGFENFTDEIAEETIGDIEKLCILFFELYQKELSEEQKPEA